MHSARQRPPGVSRPLPLVRARELRRKRNQLTLPVIYDREYAVLEGVERPKTRGQCAAWRAPCVLCDGSGNDDGIESAACVRCDGTGLEFVRIGAVSPVPRVDWDRYALWRAQFEPRPGQQLDAPKLKGCIWAGCRHHLAIEVDTSKINAGGGVVPMMRNFPGVEIEDMRETCSLDVADRGPQKLEAIGDLVNSVKENARLLEAAALASARAAMERDGVPGFTEGQGDDE